MSSPPIPILLTSSVVVHDSSVKLLDTNERIQFTLESIAQWRRIAPESPIVICDGSNYDFSELISQHFPNSPIETLHFINDKALVAQHGRGYGEGEIVRYAINNSQAISFANCFAKCTSKLWVKNYNDCLKYWNGNLLLKGVFNDVFSLAKPPKLAYIDTRFYMSSKTTYLQHFADAHLKIRILDYGLEDSYKDIFIEKHLAKCMLPIHPVICGVGGGTGTYYRNPPLRILKEKVRYKLVSLNSKFSKFFQFNKT